MNIQPGQPFLPQFDSPAEPNPFVTQEARASATLDSFAPFWRLDDPLCARLLREGKSPRRFPWVKAIFPLVRAASLFQFPREAPTFHAWQPFAFFAGLEYGRELPAEAAVLLADDASSSGSTYHGLRRLRDALADREGNPWNLYDAFGTLRGQGCAVAEAPEPALIRLTSAGFRLGLAAATTAKSEPDLADFLARLYPRVTARRTQLHVRALFHSCTNARGRRVQDLLEHPLLTVAANKYPITPLEKATILPFFHAELHAFGVRSENECPTDDLAIVTWVGRAWHWGTQLRHREPGTVEKIFIEIGREEFEGTAKSVERVIREAGSLRAADLTRAFLGWYERNFGWSQPHYYGQALDRVVHFADCAIWASWLHSES